MATALNHDDQATTGARPSASSCSTSITVLADPAWAESVRQAGKAWGESLGQADCGTVTVAEQATATTLSKGLGSTDAWIPEDPSAIAEAKDPAPVKAASTTVGSSPLVLVNTPEAHEALGKPLQGEAPPTSLNTATPAQVDLTKAEQRIVDQVPLAQVTQKLATDPADANGLTAVGPRAGVTALALALASKTPVRASWLQPSAGLSMGVISSETDEDVTAFTT
ncbi:hypothetical protein [Luteococcus sediminum]